MNLPSGSIDDIPTREGLKRLVDGMEALAQTPEPGRGCSRTCRG
jgi:hypothetical protein